MSHQPLPKFQVDDTVIDHEHKMMGKVTDCEWRGVVHSYTYTYECRYITDEIQGPDTVWEKVHPTPKFGSEHLLEKVVEDGNASKPGEAGP